jgi:hypothetical protein
VKIGEALGMSFSELGRGGGSDFLDQNIDPLRNHASRTLDGIMWEFSLMMSGMKPNSGQLVLWSVSHI